jgi:hypothetical protein
VAHQGHGAGRQAGLELGPELRVQGAVREPDFEHFASLQEAEGAQLGREQKPQQQQQQRTQENRMRRRETERLEKGRIFKLF